MKLNHRILLALLKSNQREGSILLLSGRGGSRTLVAEIIYPQQLHVYLILVFDILDNEQTTCHRMSHCPPESVW